jgi:hypothetical protein
MKCKSEKDPRFKCINLHEYLEDYKDWHVRECLAFQAELECLKQHKDDCKSDFCHDQVSKHIKNFVEQAMVRHGCKAILPKLTTKGTK